MAQQYLAGDKSVLQNVGRGKQGAGNIVAVRRAIRAAAEAQGLKPGDVAARLAEYNGYVAEQRTMGTQQANTEMASSEAQQMITNARQASADVPRSEFLPWSKLGQMSDKQINNAKLASLKAATQAVLNTWARAINPKGVATVSDKEHGEQLLNAAMDQDAYDAVLDRFEQEAQASLAAPQSAKQRLHDAFIGSQVSTAGAGGPAGPPSGALPVPAAGTNLAAPGRGAPPGGGPAATVPPPPGFVVQ
jgi:pyruvoyl-dependent arginine decarboxylase (PvlArgDC)